MKKFRKYLLRSLIVLLAISLTMTVIAASWYFSNRVAIPEATDALTHRDSFVAPEVGQQTLEILRQQLLQLRRDENHPAVSVCLARNGKVLWSEAQGLANIEANVNATRQTQFPIGSVSKPITATAAMLLIEQGKMSLDDTVESLVPEFPKKPHSITVRQLLSHQAGIRHYKMAWKPPWFTEMGINQNYESVGASLSLFADDPLVFAPDSSFKYTTFGYTLLSAAMENAAGDTFLNLMHTSLFEPLAMTSTLADDRNSRPESRSTDYMSMFDGWVVRLPKTDSSCKWGGGVFLSTPDDLARFGIAVLKDQIVSAESRKLMFEPRTTSDGQVNPQNYGLGWRSAKLQLDSGPDHLVQIVHHGGTSVGAQCVLLLVPDSDIVVAICANSYTGGSGDLLRAAASFAKQFIAKE